MRINGALDKDVLHDLGAFSCTAVEDESGGLIGWDVTPELPLNGKGLPVGYAEKLAERTLAALPAYAERKHAQVLNGGIRVDVGNGLKADVASDVGGRGLVSGCVGLADLAAKMEAPEPTFPWINNDGSKLTLSAAQVQTIALALGQFVQATYGTLGDVISAIGKGAITDEAGVDAAAWPQNG